MKDGCSGCAGPCTAPAFLERQAGRRPALAAARLPRAVSGRRRRLFDVNNLDDGCVPDPMECHDRVAPCAVAHRLGVLDSCRKHLVRGIGVSRARRALGEQRDEASRDQALACGRLAAAGPLQAVGGKHRHSDGENRDNRAVLGHEARRGAAARQNNNERRMHLHKSACGSSVRLSGQAEAGRQTGAGTGWQAEAGGQRRTGLAKAAAGAACREPVLPAL
eukprot:358619-Chlamydomonas_euryale.AAC.14